MFLKHMSNTHRDNAVAGGYFSTFFSITSTILILFSYSHISMFKFNLKWFKQSLHVRLREDGCPNKLKWI